MDMNTTAWVKDATPIETTQHDHGIVSLRIGQPGRGHVTLMFSHIDSAPRENVRRLRDALNRYLGD